MPSDKKGGRGRCSISAWRVKAGKKEVYRGINRNDCQRWMREHRKVNGNKCRLIPPNRAGNR